MKIIQRDGFSVLVPSEHEYLCSIEDQKRYEDELAIEMAKPENERNPIQEVYMFTEAFVPESRSIEKCQEQFMEIGNPVGRC